MSGWRDRRAEMDHAKRFTEPTALEVELGAAMADIQRAEFELIDYAKQIRCARRQGTVPLGAAGLHKLAWEAHKARMTADTVKFQISLTK